jgi:bis(5'-nucleosyl)-tetraphosphatase (symmetrical)
MRWVVGDIHGCAIELDRLLHAIRFDPSDDELWSVGDLVNTGPDSLELLKLWRDVGGRGVLGNHDIHALRVASGTRKMRREDRLDSLLESTEAPPLLAGLRELPILAYLPGGDHVRDAWIVHAGLHPDWSDLHEVAEKINAPSHDEDWLTSDDVAFATRVRCCTPDGEMNKDPGPPRTCQPPFAPWDHLYKGRTLIVHGHWAMRGHYRGKTTLGLDSGCVYGGRLTAWCQEEDRTVDVPGRSR